MCGTILVGSQPQPMITERVIEGLLKTKGQQQGIASIAGCHITHIGVVCCSVCHALSPGVSDTVSYAATKPMGEHSG